MKPMGQLISKFLRHVLPGVIRPLHALWNEVIGFLFIVFAVVAGFYVIRAVRNFEGDIEGLVHIVFPALFGLVMGYFGVSSFVRARKISRS
jgi:predicted CDP-diglyceride synthetase/phosphatidate cytidylyltransferase